MEDTIVSFEAAKLAKEIYDQYGLMRGMFIAGTRVCMSLSVKEAMFWREVILELDNVEPKQEK